MTARFIPWIAFCAALLSASTAPANAQRLTPPFKILSANRQGLRWQAPDLASPERG